MKNRFAPILMFIGLMLSVHYTIAQGCYPDQSNAYWKIDEDLYGSKKLSGCDPVAYYNCHGFMMSYFESVSCEKPGWTHPVATPYTCPNNYGIKSATYFQNSGRYVRVCSESNANIAYYQFQDGGDHSAVKEIISGGSIKYISKYGYNGPLVAHNLTGSWYHLSGQYEEEDITHQFWAYVGAISGNPNIVGTSPTIFSVNNISTVSYSWSIISGNNHIYISSGANQRSVTLVPTHSGPAVLRLNVSSACGSVKTQQINLNITTNICLEGEYDMLNAYDQNLNTTNNVPVGGVYITVTCPNATTFTWQKTSGNINGYFPPGPTASFNMTSGGSISFLITAKNGSTTLATRNVAFYNYGSFTAYPNPSSTTLKLDVNKDISFHIVIENLDGQIFKEIENYIDQAEIDISSLEIGEYSLKVYHEGKQVDQQHIFITK